MPLTQQMKNNLKNHFVAVNQTRLDRSYKTCNYFDKKWSVLNTTNPSLDMLDVAVNLSIRETLGTTLV